MNILLLGKSGQVGWELQRSLAVLGRVTALDHDSTEHCGDFANPEGVRETVRALRPDVIVNAAAHTAVDKAESEPEFARLLNATTPGLVAEEAARLGAWLVHYSTDYVFDGSGTRPGVETDTPAPLSVYGATKLEGEQRIQHSGCQHLILRTSWVFGSHGANFVKTMLRLGREREELAVVADQQGCPTSARSIAQALWHSAALWRRDAVLGWGVYHFAGQPAVSWHEFAVENVRQARESGLIVHIPRVRPITSQEYPTPARRPLWSVLDCHKVKARLGLEPAPWQEELRLVLAELPS